MKQWINIFLLGFALTANLHAGPLDSLIADFDKNGKAETVNKFLSALEKGGLMDEAPHFDSRTPADTLRKHLWYWAAEYYYSAQDYKRTVDYAQQALPLMDEGSESSADCLSLLSIAHLRMANYEQSITCAKQCYEMDKQSGDHDRISSSLNTLAGICLAAHQPQEAEKYIQHALKEAKKTDNPMRMAVIKGMASEVYHALGNDTLALQYIDEAYRLDSIGKHTNRIYNRLTQKASVLIGLHRYEEAETMLNDVIPYLRQIGDYHSLAIALNKLGMVMLHQDNKEAAKAHYTEAAGIFQKLGDPYNEIHSRRGLYESLWQNHPEEAQLELARFNELKDSLYNHTSAECMARYNAEFGNDWLTIENHEQKKAKHIAMALAAFIALAALLVGSWMHLRNRRQVKLNEKLQSVLEELKQSKNETPSEEERADKEDSHFMQKVLTAINEEISTGQLSVKTVAARMAMTPYKFRTELAKYTDESAQNLIQRIRMERAQHLLQSRKDLNIQEVAYLCGFTETSNFTRAFKKATGKTPSEYQEN